MFLVGFVFVFGVQSGFVAQSSFDLLGSRDPSVFASQIPRVLDTPLHLLGLFSFFFKKIGDFIYYLPGLGVVLKTSAMWGLSAGTRVSLFEPVLQC